MTDTPKILGKREYKLRNSATKSKGNEFSFNESNEAATFSK